MAHVTDLSGNGFPAERQQSKDTKTALAKATAAAPSYTEGDNQPLSQNLAGALRVTPSSSIIGPGAPTIDSYTSVAINLAAAADQSIVAAPGASKQIWVYGYQLTVNAAGTVAFQDEDNTALTGIMPLSTGIAVHPSGNFSMPLFKVATNKALELDVVTSEVDGTVQYAIVSV